MVVQQPGAGNEHWSRSRGTKENKNIQWTLSINLTEGKGCINRLSRGEGKRWKTCFRIEKSWTLKDEESCRKRQLAYSKQEIINDREDTPKKGKGDGIMCSDRKLSIIDTKYMSGLHEHRTKCDQISDTNIWILKAL